MGPRAPHKGTPPPLSLHVPGSPEVSVIITTLHASQTKSPHQTTMGIAAIADLTVITLLITTVTSQTPPTAYTNHTVDWFFNATTNSSTTNYTSWVASQSFYLGDFLGTLHCPFPFY